MRLPLIPPAALCAEPQALYDDTRRGIATCINAFKVEGANGAPMGHWNPAAMPLDGCDVPVPERE